MGKIKTHTAVTVSVVKSTTAEPRFVLSPLHNLSTNIEVKKHPKRVIAWGLMEGEHVSVHIARTASLGNSNWALTDDCCPCVVEPDPVVNVQHMPYKQCKKAVALTADDPAIHIDDAGVYYFEYHGEGEVTLEHYDDPVISKNRMCDCDF